ncbi:MAG: hypothetical protein ACYTHJ_22965, partial [Planctomycetota bacterium]
MFHDVSFSDERAWPEHFQQRYSPAGLASDVEWLDWNFSDLQPGRMYQVFVNWEPGADRASNAPYSIIGAKPLGGTATTKTVIVDQRHYPSSYTHDERPSYGDEHTFVDRREHWRSLGFVVAQSNALSVRLGTQLPDGSFADGIVSGKSVVIVETWGFQAPAHSTSTLRHNFLASGNGRFTLTDKFGNEYAFRDDGHLQGF